jgi:hypothetical protein
MLEHAFTEEEIEFIAEDQLITIIPSFSSDVLPFISVSSVAACLFRCCEPPRPVCLAGWRVALCSLIPVSPPSTYAARRISLHVALLVCTLLHALPGHLESRPPLSSGVSLCAPLHAQISVAFHSVHTHRKRTRLTHTRMQH